MSATNIFDKKCALCVTKLADKRNSHIIPKFFSKSLFHKLPNRHAVAVTPDLKSRKMQDIPKEDNLLCSDCESRLAIIETIFARHIEQIHSYKANRSIIDHVATQNYLICKHIDPTLFKLFFYSILWRLSVTSLMEYKTFQLGKEIEEELRFFVDANLKTTKKKLLSNLHLVHQIPTYDLCLLKSEDRLYPPRSFLSAHSLNSEFHLVMLSEFALFFATSECNLNNMMKFYSNKQNNNVIVGLGKENSWDHFNDLLLSQFSNR